MKNSTIKKCVKGLNRSKTVKVGIKNRLKIIATSALLLAATNTMAGLVFLPAGVNYVTYELENVMISSYSDETFVVNTNGLSGELTIQGSDFPPEYDIATTAKVIVPFDQELELVVDLAEGTVTGHAPTKYVDTATTNLIVATMEVRGNATCLPLNGRECGQLVVNLELQGVLTCPNDPSKVGQLGMEILGSLVWDGAAMAHWSAMSANTTIGGNEGLINSLLEMMEEGEGIQATPWTDGQVTE